MHVVVDGFHLWGPSRDRGLGTWVRSLLAAVAPRDDVRLSVTSPVPLALPPGVGLVPVPARPSGPLGFLDHARRTGAEARRAGADVLHLPGLPPPVRVGRPWAITIHDTFPLSLPWTSGPRQRAWLRLWVPRLRRAPAVIVPSRWTAAQVAALGVPSTRIHQVPNGVDLATFTPVGPRSSGPARVLLPASSDPRKQRHLGLQAAAALVAAGLPHRVAAVGRLAPEERTTLLAQARDAGVADRLDVLGHVDDLAATYRQADALLLPSAGEGFGYPAVEALACGTPVVAFDNSATREVVAGVARLAPDGDVHALGRLLVEAVTDPSVREAARRRGPALAAHYDLASFGEGLTSVWARLASDRTWST